MQMDYRHRAAPDDASIFLGPDRGSGGRYGYARHGLWFVGFETELQREFPLQVVCFWLGNSPRIEKRSYLRVTEDDFAKAAGVVKVMVEG